MDKHFKLQALSTLLLAVGAIIVTFFTPVEALACALVYRDSHCGRMATKAKVLSRHLDSHLQW